MTVVERAIAKIRSAGAPLDAGSREAVREIREPGSAGSSQPPSDAAILELPPRIQHESFISIDRAALEAAGFLPERVQLRRIADQYRQIKRPLLDQVRKLKAARARDAQLIMMASALSGDGKTFTSVNLALSLAREKDFTALLIDADVAKPHVSKLFGAEKERGLLDALLDERLDVETLVLPTDVPGLSILPAGKQNESATELLGSARMLKMIERLATYDPRRVMLLDSPPLLLSSESQTIVQLVGQIVMVVRAGVTPQRAVQEALGFVGDKPLGFVLNQSHMATSDGYYGYGGYGSYGDSPDEAAASGGPVGSADRAGLGGE